MLATLEHDLKVLHEELAAGCKLVEYKDKKYLCSAHGTYYNANTPADVIRALERAYGKDKHRRRVRIYYGETEGENIGLDWNEEHGTEGYVSRTTGPLHSPIIVHNTRSIGGGLILTASIVRIRWTGSFDLYRHPNYHSRKFRLKELEPPLVAQYGDTKVEYTYSVDRKELNGRWSCHARFTTRQRAKRFLDRMTS